MDSIKKNRIKITGILLFTCCLAAVCAAGIHPFATPAGPNGMQPGANGSPPVTKRINTGWKFHPGDIANGEAKNLNDKNWRVLDLPHDWSIEGEYSLQHGTDWQSGFLPAGTGWYRKSVPGESAWKGKRVKILFEGVYLNSDVWINGHHLGHRPNGYIGFEYDLTPYLTKDDNVLAVRVDHSKPLTGRWYTGSGIYRHVWLKIRDPLHIETDGVFFTTPVVDSTASTYHAEVSVSNQYKEDQPVRIKVSVCDTSGIPVSEAISEPYVLAAGESRQIEVNGTIEETELWSPDHPYLYTLHTSVIAGEKCTDMQTQHAGFRRLEFSAVNGFSLNGEITKLKGVCDHHTAGALGSAVPDDVWLYRLRLLKEMGCNAIRTAHNPFSPSFYDICDSLGLMVLNEFLDGWETEKAPHDYGLYFEEWWERDAIAFLRRDRNHPSVIMWSIGNEVRKPDRNTQKKLIDLFHRYDPTRPVTQGGHDPTRGMTGDELPSLLDIKGFNGDGEEKKVFENFHAKEPHMPMVATEVPHTYQTRGVYRTKTHWRRRDFPAMWELKSWDGTLRGLEKRLFPIPDLAQTEVFPEERSENWYQDGKEFPISITKPYQPHLYYQSSYDNASVRSSARKAWQRTRDLDYVMGQFRWGSFDYLGETNDWPSRFANFGVIDICGFPKDHFYLYQSMWRDDPMVHILPHWTHPGREKATIPVVVYTNCDEVELFLSGESLGVQKYRDEQLVWQVPYEPGTLKAIARNNGIQVATHQHTTAGPPARLITLPDKSSIRANGTDVVHVMVHVADREGHLCPHAANEIEFEVTGPVKIIGVDNGDPLDLSRYKTNTRRAFHGKVMLWIQSTGEPGTATIRSGSGNIQSDPLHIQVNAL